MKFLGIQPRFKELITLKFWFLVVGFRFGNACTSKTAKFNEDSEKIKSLRQAMESLYAQRLNRLDFISAKDRFHRFDNAVVAVRPKKISEFRNFFTELSLKKLSKTLNDIDPNDHKSTVDMIAEYAE